MTQKQYSRFSIEEREILHKRLAEKKKQREIAEELSRSKSVISREIRRAGMTRKTYSPIKAERDAAQQSLKRKKKSKLTEDQPLATFVEEKLKVKWSPEQISGVLKNFPPNSTACVSHESIYRYIYSIEDQEHKTALVNCLRRSRKRRRRRKKGSKKRTSIRDLTSIHARPEEVHSREVVGHWEGDLIIGKDHKSAIGTLVERTTRLTIIVSFQGGISTTKVVHGFAAALGVLPPHMKKSLTYDRGTEMSNHKKFTEITGIPVYFADPYCSWQRGTNENTNGLIRAYFPKGTDFRVIDDEALLMAQNELNIRPRKCLNFCTPSEMFDWFTENSGCSPDHFYSICYPQVM